MNKPKLFLFHFAGGNCYSFQFLTPFLKNFEVIPLELPGRGKRIKEALITNFELAAEDLFKQVLQHLDDTPFDRSRFMIYGHSMGAGLSLKVTSMLEAAGKMPVHIVVSGNAGPYFPHVKRKLRYCMDKETLKEELQYLGGIPEEVLESDELFDFYEPIIRADFEVVEVNELYKLPPVRCPVFAVMGNEEETVGNIMNWEQFTGSFKYEILPGNHFFIHSHASRLADLIRSCYAKTILYQY